MRKSILLLAIFFVTFFSGIEVSKACNLSYVYFQSIVDEGAGIFKTSFKSCVGGGAKDTASTWIYGGDFPTTNIHYVVWGSGVSINHVASASAYPTEIASPMPSTCTNCKRVRSYTSQYRKFAILDIFASNVCPVATANYSSGTNAFPTNQGPIRGNIWYSANDDTDQCWNAGFIGTTCTANACTNRYPTAGTRLQPRFVDRWHLGPTRAPYCFDMFIRTTGRPDSIEMKNIENSNGWNSLCNYSDSDPLNNDQTIRLTAGLFPVQWLHYSGIAIEDQKKIKVSWGTAIEDNCDQYIVTKSTDGISFNTTIGSLKASGSKEGRFEYAIDDLFPVSGNNYYKIVEMGKDNSSIFTEVITVNYSGAVSSHINYISPVPTVDKATVSVYSESEKTFKVFIYDIKGRTVLESEMKASSGENKFSVDLSNHESGIYFINFSSGTEKFGGKLLKAI